MKPKIVSLFRLALLAVMSAVGLLSATEERIAVLKGQDVMITDTDGKVLIKLPNDPRLKGNLQWLPDGRRLSYIVKGPERSKGRLVIVDETGVVVKEVTVLPNDPGDGIRFIESVEWVSATKVRLGGSANPRNWGQFDLDVETGEESNWQWGCCASFIASPDGKHIAYLGLLAMGPDEERADGVEMDHERVEYSGEGSLETRPGIRVLAGPAWCEDSKNVVFLERTRGSAETAVTFLSVSGGFKRIPVPTYLADKPEIACANGRAVAGTGKAAVLVDPEISSPGNVTPEIKDLLTKRAEVEARRQRFRDMVDSVVKRLGGREGVGWRPAEAQ
jgi:hypothetical protein